jgi:hypothetical protein
MTTDNDTHGGDPSTPKQKPDMRAAIAEARQRLSSLPDDWDDNGGTRVPDCTLRFMEQVLLGLGEVPVPSITPGPGLTVDLRWRGNREMLINITPKATITFYGQRQRREGWQEIRGKEELHMPHWKWKLKAFFR